MLSDKRFIRTLHLQNLLSFGPSTPPLELSSLNVFIGPNGSGKSNIIEVIDLLRASATDLTVPVRAGGGVAEWLWKGVEATPIAELNATIYYPNGLMPLRHTISFTMEGQRFYLVDEAVENEREEFVGAQDVRFYYRYQKGRPVLRIRTTDDNGATEGNDRRRQLRREDLALDQSVLSQRKDPDQYPEITYLGDCYKQIKLYREWSLGRNTPPRRPQQVDLPNDFLAEDASNLALVLNDLEYRGEKGVLLAQLEQFYGQFEDFTTRFWGGTVQIFFREKNLRKPVSAARLSDGTLRFLCLASILCHPSPPPLFCIEEPEIGLHPDILPHMAELLVQASQRTQIIVTTHSDILVDALSDVPEAVLVCENEGGATSVRRLSPEDLEEWLKEYSLGDLWRSGELGGNRW